MDNKYKKLFFLSDIIIIFFEFFFIIFNKKIFDKVSIVLPDFEVIINKTFDKSLFFAKLTTFSSLRLLKKKVFFLIFSFKKALIASVPKIEPPIPMNTIVLYFLNLFNSFSLKLNLNLSSKMLRVLSVFLISPIVLKITFSDFFFNLLIISLLRKLLSI